MYAGRGSADSARSLSAIRDQPVDERAALLELAHRDELVRLVRLLDRAGADHDRRDAGGRKKPRLGAVGDLAVRVAAAELLGERHHVVRGRRVEAGEARLLVERDPSLGTDR